MQVQHQHAYNNILWRLSMKSQLEDWDFVPSTRHQNCLNKSLPSGAAGPKSVLVSVIS